MNIFAKVGAVAFAAAFLATPGVVSSQELKKVRIGISSTSFPAAGARIAKEMGLFEKNGLDASVTPMDNSSVATSGLISGSLDFTSTSATEVIVAQARGQQAVAVASIYAGVGGVVVLSKDVAAKLGVSPTAPVSERLKALDGILIASPAATSQFTFILKGAAESVGANVRFTYMSQEAMLAAFASGGIQGFMASSPYYGVPALNGTGVIWISGPKREFPAQFAAINALTLNAMRSYAQANPDTVNRVKASLEQFADAVKDRPADVKAAIIRLFPTIDARTLDFLYENESAGFRPRPLTVEDLAHEIQVVKSSGASVPLDNIKPAELLWR